MASKLPPLVDQRLSIQLDKRPPNIAVEARASLTAVGSSQLAPKGSPSLPLTTSLPIVVRTDIRAWKVEAETRDPSAFVSAIRGTIAKKLQLGRESEDDRVRLEQHVARIHHERILHRANAGFVFDVEKVIACASPAMKLASIKSHASRATDNMAKARNKRDLLEDVWYGHVVQAASSREQQLTVDLPLHNWMKLILAFRFAHRCHRLKGTKPRKVHTKLATYLVDVGPINHHPVSASLKMGWTLVRHMVSLWVGLRRQRKRAASDQLVRALRIFSRTNRIKRAMMLFFDRIRRAQRAGRRLVTMSRLRRELIGCQWDLAEDNYKQRLLNLIDPDMSRELVADDKPAGDYGQPVKASRAANVEISDKEPSLGRDGRKTSIFDMVAFAPTLRRSQSILDEYSLWRPLDYKRRLETESDLARRASILMNKRPVDAAQATRENMRLLMKAIHRGVSSLTRTAMIQKLFQHNKLCNEALAENFRVRRSAYQYDLRSALAQRKQGVANVVMPIQPKTPGYRMVANRFVVEAYVKSALEQLARDHVVKLHLRPATLTFSPLREMCVTAMQAYALEEKEAERVMASIKKKFIYTADDVAPIDFPVGKETSSPPRATVARTKSILIKSTLF